MRPAFASLALLLVAVAVTRCGGDEGDGEPASFEGVPWLLVSGRGIAGWEGETPSATFEGGTVSGSTGSNRFTGPYSVDGDTLELGAVASTRMACPPALDAVERAYLAALDRVEHWRSDGEELVLLDGGDAEVLRFEAGTPGGSWQATGVLRGDAFEILIPDTEITATFTDDGELTGSAGCNSYTATFEADRGGIEIANARRDAKGLRLARRDHGAGAGVSRRDSHSRSLPRRRPFARAPGRQPKTTRLVPVRRLRSAPMSPPVPVRL